MSRHKLIRAQQDKTNAMTRARSARADAKAAPGASSLVNGISGVATAAIVGAATGMADEDSIAPVVVTVTTGLLGSLVSGAMHSQGIPGASALSGAANACLAIGAYEGAKTVARNNKLAKEAE